MNFWKKDKPCVPLFSKKYHNIDFFLGFEIPESITHSKSQSHFECLCESSNTPQNKTKSVQNEVVSETNVSSLFPETLSKEIPKQKIYYLTLRAQIINNCVFNVRIICDSASERSYVCQSTAEKAKLKTVGKEKLKIYAFASNNPSISDLKRKQITLKNCSNDS